MLPDLVVDIVSGIMEVIYEQGIFGQVLYCLTGEHEAPTQCNCETQTKSKSVCSFLTQKSIPEPATKGTARFLPAQERVLYSR